VEVNPEEIRDEFVKAGDELLKNYSNLEERFWNAVSGQRNPTPSWVLKHNVEHYEEHRKEIGEETGGVEIILSERIESIKAQTVKIPFKKDFVTSKERYQRPA